MKIKGQNDGRHQMKKIIHLSCNNMDPDDVAILSQVGFDEWYASASDKDKKKIFKRVQMRHKMGWRIPHVFNMIEVV